MKNRRVRFVCEERTDTDRTVYVVKTHSPISREGAEIHRAGGSEQNTRISRSRVKVERGGTAASAGPVNDEPVSAGFVVDALADLDRAFEILQEVTNEQGPARVALSFVAVKEDRAVTRRGTGNLAGQSNVGYRIAGSAG